MRSPAVLHAADNVHAATRRSSQGLHHVYSWHHGTRAAGVTGKALRAAVNWADGAKCRFGGTDHPATHEPDWD
jgi:hypothetical protein